MKKDETAWIKWYNSYEKPIGQKERTYINFVDFINRLTGANQKGSIKILDIGCGRGELMNCLHVSNPHYEIIGIDIVKELWKSQEKRKLNFVCGDANRLPFKDNSFNVIVFYDVLHHLVGKDRSLSVLNIANFFRDIVRICKTDAYILFKEQCLLYKVNSHLIFWITSIASILDISLPTLSIYKDIIVSFLTPKEIDFLLVESNLKPIFIRKERDNNPGFMFRKLLPAIRYIYI